MHCLFLTILITVAPAQTGLGQAAPQETVQQLIQDLGAQKFSSRQQATAKLRKLGSAAVPALREARKSSNPEVRTRVERLLASILGTQMRVDFLKDPSLERARQTLIWPRLRALSGSDAVAVKTLGRWFEAEPRLFEARVLGGRELGAEIQQRAARLSDFANAGPEVQSVLPSVQAILFVAGDPAVDLDRRAATAAASVLQLAETQRALTDKSSGDPLTRRLAGEWIRRPGNQYEKLVLTLKYDLPEGLQLAESIIRSKARGARMEYALHVVGKLGGADHVQLLKSQLGNATRLSGPRVGAVRQPGGRPSQTAYEYQVRDVALAMLWHLHGEHPGRHGFDSRRIRPHAWFVYSLGTLGFSSEEARTAARADWDRFLATSVKKP